MNKKTLLIILISSILSFSVSAQWGSLQNGVVVGATFNEELRTMVKWNGNLVVGGYIENMSGTTVKHVAVWNGANWSALGTNLSASVNCLAVFNGVLYAGLNATSNSLVRWNTGTNTWVSAGTFNGVVNGLYADTINNFLYAGGNFTSPGSLVAKFNGSTWSNVGSGLAIGSFPAVNCITMYKDTLYAGGAFFFTSNTNVRNVAKFNGSNWVKAANNLPSGAVFSFATYNGKLHIAGSFSQVGTTSAKKIAVKDADSWSWLPVGEGVNNDVFGMAYYNGELYVTGIFTTTGSGATNTTRIARWNGYEWRPVTSGLNEVSKTLYNHRDTLYVAGIFDNAGGVSGTSMIASWYNPFRGCKDTDYLDYNDDVDIPVQDSCKILKVYGCMNSGYFEYNPNANVNVQDSCQNIIIYGCLNPDYLEYNPQANVSDTAMCQTLKVYGCMNSNYEEYNPNANVNVQDSCINLITGIVRNFPNSDGLKIYPNPTESKLNITVTNSELLYVLITDVLGKEIKIDNISNSSTISLNLKSDYKLSNGIYNLKIITKTKIFNKRIIIQ